MLVVENICGKDVLNLEWNTECMIEGESDEQVEDELESVTLSAEWFMQGWRNESEDRKLIEVMHSEMSDWWFLEKKMCSKESDDQGCRSEF